MKLSKYEQETIILYNQAELTASVYTHDPKLLEKLAGLSEKYPQQIQPDGPNRYIVPKGCVLVREPYSEKRRAAAKERAKLAGLKPPIRGASSETS